MNTLLEIREYVMSDGTTFLLKLDRRTMKASFVEWNNQKQDYTDKKWLFAGREANYMNGWTNIFRGMEYVSQEAKKVLEAWSEQKTSEFIDMLMMADKEIRKADAKSGKGAKK